MKFLITGGAGFIGSHLAETLLHLSEDVIVFDDFSSGRYDNLKDLPVRVIEGDIRDADAVHRAMKGVDTVFHMAALGSVARSVVDPHSTQSVNINGTLNVLDAARKAEVRRLIFSSSSSVYGESEVLPKHENMLPSPLSVYAVSKITGEYYCQSFRKTHGLQTVCLRYFNVFGPRQDPSSEYAAVIPKFITAAMAGEKPRIYGDGSQSRDFTYVDNVVQANLLAAERPWMPSQPINVACGERTTLLELLNHLEDIFGKDLSPVFADPRPGDVRHSHASIKRAQEVLGFKPLVDFDEGIQRTVEWFRAAADEPVEAGVPYLAARTAAG